MYKISSVKTSEMQSIKIKGYYGKWSAFEKLIYNNRLFYIMEHDIYGDETTLLVIEIQDGNIVNIYETFDDIITCLIDYDVLN